MTHTLQQSPRLLRVAVALLMGVGLATTTAAQTKIDPTIDRAEYFWDDDPGYNKATVLPLTPGSAADIVTQLPAPAQSGQHVLGLRYHGTNGWSTTTFHQVYVPVTGTTDVSRAEYFWDDDPGFGQGTPLSITPGQTVSVDQLLSMSSDLGPGQHQLGLRYQGTNGWSPTVIYQVFVPISDDTSISSAEYFWDDDPGFGQGTPLSITPGQAVSVDQLLSVSSELAPGQHQLGLRYRGTNGWSPTTVYEVYKPREGQQQILYAEYFWNEDPGFGQGTPISITPGQEVSLADFGVPTFTVHGDATLFIRYRGTNGWSPTVAQLVMVDAEGYYTLNANAETSMETRNYQSVADAISDFADRGIGDCIELGITTTDTTYELDATAAGLLQQVDQAAESLEAISTERDTKTITFSAAEGSGNTVSITATDLSDVMPLLTRIATVNVTLLVNGTEMDFTATTQRQQTVCSGTATEAVELTYIADGITATFTAQPHAATVLSGFAAETTGTLPAMAITNSGTATDSVAYAVTLKQGGQPLYTYTYYIYTRANMANQAFTGLSPAAGSSLDPGTVTLSWNALQEVESYRLTVTDVTNTNEPATVLDGFAVETTTYPLTIVTGHRYTWQVEAVGPCDELLSPLMTLEGRLLPDLTVSTITLPEAAQAGNMLTVTATITNQGEGTTTEGSWTDRLYYVIDGTDFSQAVQAAELNHTVNVAAGVSYEATFTMRVPAVESGMLRVFVVTDATEKVLEADEQNNRQLSSSAATLSPFYMNTDDLAVLRRLYTDFGGDQWTGTPWNTASELISDGNWSGVTFDTDGRVTAINLQGRGLTGTLSVAVPYVATLSQLTTLNMSRNALTGDPATFLAGAGGQLTALDLSYNQIDELSAALPATITTLSLGNQHRKYGASTTFPGVDALTSQALPVGSSMAVTVPSLFTYNHQKRDFSQHPTLYVWNKTMSTRYGALVWSATNECYAYSANSWKQTLQQDEEVLLVSTDALTANSLLPATMHFTRGDANLTGWVDVNDVQRTLNYVINSYNNTAFGLWAANTWTDGDAADDLINIQDIVSTVNIVLGNQGEASSRRLRKAREMQEGTDDLEAPAATNLFYADGRYIVLDANDELAAFCIELQGATSAQVRLLLNRNDWQMQTLDTAEGVRLLVFSPTGQTLPAGTTQLLRLSGDGQPISATATSAAAEPLSAAIAGTTTGIATVHGASADGAIYDMRGRRVATSEEQWHRLPKGVYIKNGRKEVKK